ncbi:MAG: acetate--CoA ligase family protein [Conexivisphaerales archaeon]
MPFKRTTSKLLYRLLHIIYMDGLLKRLYEPSTIAVVGPSPNSDNLATVILNNLITAVRDGRLKADIYAVNPIYEECLGLKCKKELEEGTDLAIIAVPTRLAEDYLLQAQDKGTRVAIVISGGFSESGGKSLRQLRGTRVLGPNTLGIVDPYSGINTMFLPRYKVTSEGVGLRSIPDPIKGHTAIIAQSGGISASLYDELLSSGVGIRSLTCMGNSDDIDAAEIVNYFSEDDYTNLIALYLEGVQDGRKLMNAISKAALKKKVIAIIAGVSEAGKRATYSHTASIINNSQVYISAMQQAGALYVTDFRDFIALIKSYQMLGTVKGRGVAVLTNSGGAGVLAADEASLRGMNIVSLHSRLIDLKEKGLLPRIASVENPVDVSASGSDSNIEAVYERLMKFDDVNSVVLISTHYPPLITDLLPSKIALIHRKSRKPTIAVELGKSPWSQHIREIYDANGIPSVDSPQQAARVLFLLYKLNELRPSWIPKAEQSSVTLTPGVHTEPELANIIDIFGFKSPKWTWVEREDDLSKIKYPIALKVFSKSIIHKTEAGAVKLNVNKNYATALFRKLEEAFPDGRIYAQEMISGIEMRVGIAHDSAFGKYIDVGAGGILTELLEDHSTKIAPVSASEVSKMLEELKVVPLLKGYRGGIIADLTSLANSISTLSIWAASFDKLIEIEINPLIINKTGSFAVDVRATVEP